MGEIQRAGTPEPKIPPQQDVRPADQGAKEPEKETETAVSNPSRVDTAGGIDRGDQREEPANKQNVRIDPKIPKALRDLMELHQVDEWDVQNVVAARGYFPSDMAVRDYPEDFVAGVLVGAWEQVYACLLYTSNGTSGKENSTHRTSGRSSKTYQGFIKPYG